jgi:hypothetical protein
LAGICSVCGIEHPKALFAINQWRNRGAKAVRTFFGLNLGQLPFGQSLVSIVRRGCVHID